MVLLLRSSSGKKIDFFVYEDILMGPIPFFLTFQAELKKFIFFSLARAARAHSLRS